MHYFSTPTATTGGQCCFNSNGKCRMPFNSIIQYLSKVIPIKSVSGYKATWSTSFFFFGSVWTLLCCRWGQGQPPLLTFPTMTNSKWFQIEPPAGTVIFGHLLCVRGTASAYLQRSEVMGSTMSVHQAAARGQWFGRGGSWASCWLCSGLKLPDSCLWWIVQTLLVGL